MPVHCLRLGGLALLLVFCVSGFVGCGKQPIAVVGDSKITRAEFLEKLEKDQGREALLGMINRQLIEDAFAASGMTLPPEKIDERMKEIKERFGSDESFAQMLASRGMTEEDVTESLAMEMKVQMLCTKDVKVDEAELKKFFKQYKSAFGQPERVKYAEIVVATKDEAAKIAAELKKEGADFAKLAKQHSVSPMSRDNGGELPPMPREQIFPPTVAQTLAGMKAGQISEPFAVEERWYIVKLIEVLPASEASLEKDRARIEEAFKSRQAKDPQQLLSELREKATVNIVDPKYADLNEMFTPKADIPSFGPEGKGAPSGGEAAPGKGGQAPPAGASPAGGKGQPAKSK